MSEVPLYFSSWRTAVVFDILLTLASPRTVELIPTLGALFPRGGLVQDPVLTPPVPWRAERCCWRRRRWLTPRTTSRCKRAIHPTPYTLRPPPSTLHPPPHTLHPCCGIPNASAGVLLSRPAILHSRAWCVFTLPRRRLGPTRWIGSLKTRLDHFVI